MQPNTHITLNLLESGLKPMDLSTSQAISVEPTLEEPAPRGR